jgi:hypothetical protein
MGIRYLEQREPLSHLVPVYFVFAVILGVILLVAVARGQNPQAAPQQPVARPRGQLIQKAKTLISGAVEQASQLQQQPQQPNPAQDQISDRFPPIVGATPRGGPIKPALPGGISFVWLELTEQPHDGDTVKGIIHLPFGTDIREASYRGYGYDTCEVDHTRRNANPPITAAEIVIGKKCRDDFRALLAQPNTFLLAEDPFISSTPGQTYDRTEARLVVWQNNQYIDVAKWMQDRGYLRSQLQQAVPPIPAQ